MQRQVTPCLIAEAATTHQVSRTRISFKGTVDAARSFHQAMRLARSHRQARRLYRRLLEILAHALVPLRPGRWEPLVPSNAGPNPTAA